MEQKEWQQKEQKVRKDERRKVKKKRRAKGTLVTLVAFIIVLLLAIGSGFIGLNPVGLFSDRSGSHSVVKDTSKQEDQPIDTLESNGAVLSITVEGSSYTYESKVYDLEGITGVIGALDQSQAITLVDKLADNQAFEAIENVLIEADIDYNILEDYE